jgi:hypothetical protein
MIKGKHRFKWKHLAAFEQLKRRLSTTPILVHPEKFIQFDRTVLDQPVVQHHLQLAAEETIAENAKWL